MPRALLPVRGVGRHDTLPSAPGTRAQHSPTVPTPLPDVFRIPPGLRAKTVPLERVRAFRRYEERVLRVTQQRRRSYWRAQWGSSVRVAFEGAPSVQLAGPVGDPRLYVKPLPGVSPVVSEIPRVGAVQVTATLPRRDRAVEVRFRSPAALDERPGTYDVTVRGPRAGSCRQTVSSLAQYALETAKGAPIVVRCDQTSVRPRASLRAGVGAPATACECVTSSGTSHDRATDQSSSSAPRRSWLVDLSAGSAAGGALARCLRAAAQIARISLDSE